MIAQAVRCVVFDIDDTLYLERDYVRSGFHAVGEWARERLGVDGLEGRAWDAFLAGERGSIFDGVLVASGVAPEPDVVRDLVSVYRSHAPSISLLSDARACLERLDGRLTVAVVTDGPLESQQAKARVLDLARWASPLLFTAELGESFFKPRPDAFRLVQEQAGHDAAECAYVADNPAKDFAGPRELGWRTVRVRRPGGLHYDAPGGEHVDVEIEDLDRLDGALPLAQPGTKPVETAR